MPDHYHFTSGKRYNQTEIAIGKNKLIKRKYEIHGIKITVA